ncbi:MAG: isoprenyl transferase [Bacteroidia bacterium]|nr:isoprenyl transferase [Bacteroidia bacterium]
MSLKNKINLDKLPVHVAVIMDGNGRWANKQGKMRVFGHQHGVQAVRDITEAAAELGVNYLTLYAFSTENWNRPKEEVNALMELLIHTIHGERHTLKKNNVKLRVIGDVDSLPPDCFSELTEAIEETAGNKRLTLVLALSYSSRWELTKAMKDIAKKVQEGQLDSTDINENTIEENLNSFGIPHPELLIRTSGEYRISNFLLWQIAYSELYFTPKLWPEFGKEDFYEALIDFQQRERRFGMVSEQIQKTR